jgi:hypothetical protein
MVQNTTKKVQFQFCEALLPKKLIHFMESREKFFQAYLEMCNKIFDDGQHSVQSTHDPKKKKKKKKKKMKKKKDSAGKDFLMCSLICRRFRE